MKGNTMNINDLLTKKNRTLFIASSKEFKELYKKYSGDTKALQIIINLLKERNKRNKRINRAKLWIVN